MVWQGTGQLCPHGSHADLRLSVSPTSGCGFQSRYCDVYLCTEPSVGLTTLLGIGLEDGLILMIPKRDQSSLLLDIINRVWG